MKTDITDKPSCLKFVERGELSFQVFFFSETKFISAISYILFVLSWHVDMYFFFSATSGLPVILSKQGT